VREEDGGEVTVGISGSRRPFGGFRFGRGVDTGPRRSGVLEKFDCERCRGSWGMSIPQQRVREAPRMGQRRPLSHHDMTLQL
jgi:hypothetical protein